FGIAEITSEIKAAPLPPQPAAAWLTRARLFNELLLRLLANHKWIVPRKLWRKFIDEFSLTGPPIDPASLAKISDAFANRNEALCVAFPALNPAMLRPVPPGEAWIEPDPQMGFRASQYLLAFMW